MEPHVTPKQPGPETLHVTNVFGVPVTAAVNCNWLPMYTVEVGGETVTVTAAEMPDIRTANVTSAVMCMTKRFMFQPPLKPNCNAVSLSSTVFLSSTATAVVCF